MTSMTPICAYCVHFHTDNRDSETCTAFPEGIPRDILDGRNNHMMPFPGDHGVLFTPMKGFEFLRGPTEVKA